ncbi:GAF domain-containing protein [Thiovibrio sp. JS02]
MPADTSAILDCFHAFTEAQKDACFLLDHSGKVQGANGAAMRFLGQPEDSLIGKNIADLAAPPRETIADYLKKCARTNSPTPGSLIWHTPSAMQRKTPCRGFRLHLPFALRNSHLVLQAVIQEQPGDRFIALNRTLEELRTSRHTLLSKSRQLEEEIRERITAEGALKTSHARLTTILDSIEALVYVADMQTYEVLFINRYSRDLLGEITGATCWRTIQAGQTGPCPFCTNKLLLKSDGSPASPHVWELRNTRTNRWFHIVDRAIRWVDDRIVRLEIATDITERKLNEEKLLLDEARTEALFNLTQLQWASREELAEYALEEAVRLTASTVGYLHFMNPDQETIELFSWSQKVHDECSAAKNTHYPLSRAGIWADCARERRPVIHNDYPSQPGRKGYPEGHFPVRRHLSVPVMAGDAIVAICGVGNKENPYDESDVRQLSLYMNSMWNILRQKQSELLIRKAKEEWEQTFNAIDEVVTIHDTTMTVLRANRAAGKLFGVESSTLVGQRCHEIFRGSPEPCAGCPELLAQADGKPHSGELHHPSLKKTFAVSSAPLFNEEGAIRGFVHIAKDITAQTMLQDQLRQSQKMEAVGTLAGGIAHDFNNILSPIIGYTELALHKLGPASAVAPDLDEVLRASTRAKDLVRQILAFSRQSGHERKPLHMEHLVKEDLKLLRASLPSSIEIRQNIAADCGAVMGDPTEIHQIIMNLCTNAFHAMKNSQTGTLAVSLQRFTIEETDAKTTMLGLAPGPYVKLVISDTGCGMDQATREKAFEPYFTTKPKGEGTGLGLAVVHGIVSSYGGRISLYSEPGKGTTFNILFPAGKEKPLFSENILKTALPKGNGERILVVDDEQAIVNMNTLILEGLGYRVTGFTNCEEAVKAIRTRAEDFDIVITDMTMPKMSGIDLTREIHALRPGLPVILCTGYSELINDDSAVGYGICKYLMKPVSTRDLATAIREALTAK